MHAELESEKPRKRTRHFWLDSGRPVTSWEQVESVLEAIVTFQTFVIDEIRVYTITKNTRLHLSARAVH